jgi:hypothetical protein
MPTLGAEKGVRLTVATGFQGSRQAFEGYVQAIAGSTNGIAHINRYAIVHQNPSLLDAGVRAQAPELV